MEQHPAASVGTSAPQVVRGETWQCGLLSRESRPPLRKVESLSQPRSQRREGCSGRLTEAETEQGGDNVLWLCLGQGIVKEHRPVIARLLRASFLPEWAIGFACQREKCVGGKFWWPLMVGTGLVSLVPQTELDAGRNSRAGGIGVALPACWGPTHPCN